MNTLSTNSSNYKSPLQAECSPSIFIKSISVRHTINLGVGLLILNSLLIHWRIVVRRKVSGYYLILFDIEITKVLKVLWWIPAALLTILIWGYSFWEVMRGPSVDAESVKGLGGKKSAESNCWDIKFGLKFFIKFQETLTRREWKDNLSNMSENNRIDNS